MHVRYVKTCSIVRRTSLTCVCGHFVNLFPHCIVLFHGLLDLLHGGVWVNVPSAVNKTCLFFERRSQFMVEGDQTESCMPRGCTIVSPHHVLTPLFERWPLSFTDTLPCCVVVIYVPLVIVWVIPWREK